ncbi:MAG: SAM-dependent methyltransferase [Chitinophagaceae bacterium]|nr:SAM-dependent methyltransferase [Chitinophagaceae bacterium]
MYSKTQLLLKYLQYWWNASNGKGHGVHSPFVFDFITKVINDKKDYPAYSKIETIRHELKKDATVLTIKDFGAGSRVDSSKQRKISSIAKSALKSRKFAQLLFRMVKYFEPSVILELGTSLGITSCYLAEGNSAARIITMEGAPEVAAVAKNNFQREGLKNIRIVEGNFDHTLPSVLNNLDKIDFAFIDGNHRKLPTLEYFNQLKSKIHPGTVLIFDDIHWSREMEEAWKELIKDATVTLSVDLFFIGILFFKDHFIAKQHFAIRT